MRQGSHATIPYPTPQSGRNTKWRTNDWRGEGNEYAQMIDVGWSEFRFEEEDQGMEDLD
jgi:hypothetical protein